MSTSVTKRSKSRAQEYQTFCPRFHHAVELIGKRWAGAIVRAMLSGPQRFSQLCASVPGLSDRLLSERLRELEDEGVVERSVDEGPPVRVIYSLTQAGRDLDRAMHELGSWAERWIPLKRVG